MSRFIIAPNSRFPEIYPDREVFNQRFRELQKQNFYIADLHVHSAQSDGIHSLKNIAVRCMALGISAAVTDHNRVPDLNGLSSREAASLIPAIEVTSSEGVDVLCYFYDFSALGKFYHEVVAPNKKYTYKISLPCEEILLALKERKCVVNIPHPDYPADSLRENFLRLIEQGALSTEALSVIHCIEIFNASRDRSIKETKKNLALSLGKYITVGSDAHTKAAVGNALTFCKTKNHIEFLDHLATCQTGSIAVSTRIVDKSLPKVKMGWLHIKGLLTGRLKAILSS